MSQEQVYRILKQNNGMMTSKEIAEKVKISKGSLSMNLKALRRSGLVISMFNGKKYYYKARGDKNGFEWRYDNKSDKHKPEGNGGYVFRFADTDKLNKKETW